jgi:hypothetical protein
MGEEGVPDDHPARALGREGCEMINYLLRKTDENVLLSAGITAVSGEVQALRPELQAIKGDMGELRAQLTEVLQQMGEQHAAGGGGAAGTSEQRKKASAQWEVAQRWIAVAGSPPFKTMALTGDALVTRLREAVGMAPKLHITQAVATQHLTLSGINPAMHLPIKNAASTGPEYDEVLTFPQLKKSVFMVHQVQRLLASFGREPAVPPMRANPWLHYLSYIHQVMGEFEGLFVDAEAARYMPADVFESLKAAVFEDISEYTMVLAALAERMERSADLTVAEARPESIGALPQNMSPHRTMRALQEHGPVHIRTSEAYDAHRAGERSPTRERAGGPGGGGDKVARTRYTNANPPPNLVGPKGERPGANDCWNHFGKKYGVVGYTRGCMKQPGPAPAGCPRDHPN